VHSPNAQQALIQTSNEECYVFATINVLNIAFKLPHMLSKRFQLTLCVWGRGTHGLDHWKVISAR